MTKENKILSAKMIAFRRENHLNQFEFAEECGISRETVRLIECMKTNATLDTLGLIAKRMGVSVAELLTDYDGLTE